MADVRLNIGGREYVVTCRDGEEERLRALGKMVDEKAEEAGGSASGLNESRQLLFASLLLADKLADHDAAPAQTPASANTAANDEEAEKTAEMLEKLADRLEAVANKLEQ